jgi:hypothetical protein
MKEISIMAVLMFIFLTITPPMQGAIAIWSVVLFSKLKFEEKTKKYDKIKPS